MKSKNINSKTIFTLKSDLLDKVVKDYIDYITNPLSKLRRGRDDDSDFAMKFVCGSSQSKKVSQPTPLKVDKYTDEILIWNLPRPSYEKSEAKIRRITHLLFRAYLRSKNGYFNLSSSALKRITEQYKYILDVLSWDGVIGFTHNYTTDIKYDKTTYWIKDPKMFHLINVSALKTASKKEIQLSDKWYVKKTEKATQEIIQATSEQFVERYNHSLRQLRIDETSALAYIDSQQWEKPHSALSRMYTVSKISQKHKLRLTTIDNYGRLYHIGTELQRDIKKFTNIKYIIDCKNSHPFLLSGVILRFIISDNIDIGATGWTERCFSTLLYNVMRFLLDNRGIYLHYMFSDYIRKILENSTLRKQEIAKVLSLAERLTNVKPDVWLYIYDAASGRLWDNLVEQLNEERTTVKEKVFKSVVYSYTKKRNKKKEAENKWLKAFIDRYPTAYDIIVQIKRSIHNQCVEKGLVSKLKKSREFHINESLTIEINTKDDVLLSTLMMRLESNIFTEILKRLFKKRITCFGIHDAVAVINPKKMTDEDIKNIILDVYKDYGLLPTLAIEYYGDK